MTHEHRGAVRPCCRNVFNIAYKRVIHQLAEGIGGISCVGFVWRTTHRRFVLELLREELTFFVI